MRRFFLAAAFLLIATGGAWAQSGCSYLRQGTVLTPAQWNQCFAQKQNLLTYVPVNKAGDTMTGTLITSASTTERAGFNMPQGAAPTSPANGDVWTTSAGMFVRIAGATVGPFGTGIGTGSALSVLGVTGGSPALNASIAGATDQILRVNGAGTALAFGAIDLSKSASVGTSLLPMANGGLGADISASVGIPSFNAGTLNFRTLTGTANEITVTNGTGAGGNPTLSLPNTLILTGKAVSGNNFTITGGTITGMPTPTNPSDVATKGYADGIAGGISPRASVALATTANITRSGEQTIDGVLTSSTRILVKNQTAPAENGVFVTAAGAWSRATDFDTAGEMTAGAAFVVTGGTVGIGQGWALAATVATVNTSPANFNLYQSISGALLVASNLSDLSSPSTARTNLGLAAVAASGSATDLTSGLLAKARGGWGVDTSSFAGVPFFAAGTATLTSTTGTGPFARQLAPTFGDGTGGQIVSINGAASGSGAGAGILFKNAGTTSNAIGNYSSIIGGTFNTDLLLYQASGSNTIRFNIGATSYATVSTSGIAIVASGYLNFGATAGTSGYGFQDVTGTMQFKNSGGAWAAIQATTYTPNTTVSTRLISNKEQEDISVTDCGADPDGTHTASRAANDSCFAATTAYTSGSALRPKVIRIPGGEYQLATSWTIPSNTRVICDAAGGTILNFGALSGSGQTGDGIKLLNHNNISIENCYVTQAAGNGISAASSAGTNPASLTFKNVISRFNGSSGFDFADAYLVSVNDSVSSNNAGSGFQFNGFHTSVKVSRSSASDNADGFYIDNMVYSHFDTTTTDDNRLYGYNIRRAQGVTFTSCGGERNATGMFLLQASNAIGGDDIQGLKIQSCFAQDNGGSTSLIEASSLNGRVIDVTMDGMQEIGSPSGTSVIANGNVKIRRSNSRTVGAITVASPGFMSGVLDAAPGFTGTKTTGSGGCTLQFDRGVMVAGGSC